MTHSWPSGTSPLDRKPVSPRCGAGAVGAGREEEEEEDDEEEEEEEEAQDSKNFFLVRPALTVDNSSVMCMTGFPGVAPRAVFFPSVVKPRMLLLGRYVPEGQLSVAFAWLVFAGYVTFALCSLLLSARRVVHFLDKLFSPVVVQRQVPVLVRTVLSVARGDSTGAFLGRIYCHVNRWITDPEVDSQLSGHVFLPLGSDSHLLFSSSAEYTIWIFWEMTSGIIHVFSTSWFNSGYMSASVYEASGRKAHFLYVLVDSGRRLQDCPPYSALSLGRHWIHVGFSPRGVWNNFTRFLRDGRRLPFRSAEADPLLSRPQRFPSRSTLPGGRCSCCACRA